MSTRALVFILVVAAMHSVPARSYTQNPQERDERRLWLVKALGGQMQVSEWNGRQGVLTIDFSSSRVRDSDLALLSEFPDLEVLKLSKTSITSDGAKHIAACKNLTELSLADTRLKDEGLAELSVLLKLRKLDLSGTGVTDAGMDALVKLRSLEELALNGTAISHGLIKLKSINGLKRLSLKGAPRPLKNTDVFSGLSHLEELDLSYSFDKGTDFRGLRKLQSIRRLVLAGGTHSSFLGQLEGLKKLEELDLRQSSINDADLGHIQQITNLKVLDLTFTRVTDKGIPKLQNLNRLERLSLGATEVSDDGVRHVCALSSLRELELGSEVTDKSVHGLSLLTGLRRLDIHATKITKAGSAELARALPNTQIVGAPMGGITPGKKIPAQPPPRPPCASDGNR